MAKNTPGNNISRTKEAQDKLLKVTQQINKISSFAAVGVGINYNDGLGSIRTIIERLIEGPLFEVTQDLKQQGEDKIFDELRKRGIPTSKPEAKALFQEKILEKSCDVLVINIVKKSKNELDDILKGINFKIESNLKKLNKFKRKVDKIIEFLVEIVLLLGIFQTLLVALQILVSAAKLALVPLAGVFSSAKVADVISRKITKGEEFILKYVNAIQSYTTYVRGILETVISLINLIPLIIDFIENIQRLVQNFITTLNNYYKQYIVNCIPGGDTVNADGTLNLENIDKFLNFNTPNLNNIKPDILGDYTRDNEEQRIFRPKIN